MLGRTQLTPQRPRVHSWAPCSTRRTAVMYATTPRRSIRVKPTVQTLLDRSELGLGLLTPVASLPAGALSAPVVWAHSSDLADPTPFLDAGHVLLTTGTQFGDDADDPGFATAYVGRLRARGIAALGFGTEVIRAGTPEALVDACTGQGLPLFEVPYRVPFIAIARTVADLIAEDA